MLPRLLLLVVRPKCYKDLKPAPKASRSNHLLHIRYQKLYLLYFSHQTIHFKIEDSLTPTKSIMKTSIAISALIALPPTAFAQSANPFGAIAARPASPIHL